MDALYFRQALVGRIYIVDIIADISRFPVLSMNYR